MPLLLSPFGYSTYRGFLRECDVLVTLRAATTRMPTLAWNRYGKSRIQARESAARTGTRTRSSISRWTSSSKGAFDAVYTDGDNESCLATDTMKNTVYALARQDPIDHVESFGLGSRIISPPSRASRASGSRRAEHRWERIAAANRPHPHAFVQPGGEQWTAVITGRTAARRRLRPHEPRGAEDDRFGVLGLPARPVHDAARHRGPHPGDVDHGVAGGTGAARRDFGARARIRQRLVETFAAHDSRSVQHTLYAMAEAALDACDVVSEVTLTLPNRHHLLVDLTPFGLDNPNEVFVATDQPFGLIEATVKR